MANMQKEIGDNFNEKKNAEFFFRKIQENLTQLGPEVILRDVEKIIDKLEADADYVLTVKEFTLLGDLTYMIGLDMTNNGKNFHKVSCENFHARFEMIGLNDAVGFDLLNDILSNLKAENIIPAKEELKQILEKEIESKALEGSALKASLKTLFKHFTIPVNFAIGLNDIFSHDKLTYNDILKLNSLIQNNSTFDAKSLKYVINLYKDEFYIKTLQKADELFQLQKFSVLYFDCILSALELNVAAPDFLGFLSKETLEAYDFTAIEVEKSEEPVTEVPVEEEKQDEIWDERFHPQAVERAQNLQDEEPDFFVRCVLEEKLARPIKTISDFKEALDKCINSEDFIQYFYQYISANRESTKRIWFGDVWVEFTEQELKDSLNNVIVEKRAEYKKLAELMMQEIPADKANSIVNYLNECINELVITSGEAKNYLISQLVENQVSTYRHLQQMMGLVEQQQISGEGYHAYVALYNYLDSQTNCKTIFKESHTADYLAMYISVYVGVKQFYFGVEKSVEETTQESAE